MQIRAIWAALLLAVIVFPCCGEKPREERAVVSLSYSGHRRDADIDCDYCHYLTMEGQGLSASFNPFGTAYAEAGRNRAAFGRIRQQDSDGDGYSNLEEIRGGFFPGRSTSNPGKPAAPQVEVTFAAIQTLPGHHQFMLMNSPRQQRDSYSTFRGVRVSDLLTARGVDLDTIEGITVFAPEDFEEFDARNASWRFLQQKKLVIYGHGIR